MVREYVSGRFSTSRLPNKKYRSLPISSIGNRDIGSVTPAFYLYSTRVSKTVDEVCYSGGMPFFTPQFFDTFGVLVFLYLTVLALWGINSKKCLPEWSYVVLLLIGLSGLLVDGTITYVYFLEPLLQ